MSRIHRLGALGRYEATIVRTGTFALDGGAMFGIIPKPLWEKKIPADEANRVPMATNCLLLQDGKTTALVDCGMGEKWSDKQRAQFKIDDDIAGALAEVGVGADDITDVILTHLHFDHAGGLTSLHDGALSMRFSNARVHVGRRNWDWAHAPNERDRGSYRADSFSPLDGAERDRLVLIDDDGNGSARIFDDVSAIVCEGHTTGQFLPLVGAGDRRALYGADMVPTAAHIRMPWIMGYDLRPIELLQEKRRILSLCADDGVDLIFEHDVGTPRSAIARDGDDFLPASANAGGAHG